MSGGGFFGNNSNSRQQHYTPQSSASSTVVGHGGSNDSNVSSPQQQMAAPPALAPAQSVLHPLTPNGLPSANQAQEASVKRTGVLVIRVMEARSLVYPPGSQQLMARYAPYKNEAHQRPYAVIEFDKNEAVVASLGGDMHNPIWKYRTTL